MDTMKKNMIKIFLGFIIMICCVILTILNTFNHKGIILKEFNNYYDENNIVFFYENSAAPKIKALNDEYKVKEKTASEKDELKKALSICKITSDIIDYDDIHDSEKNNGYDILKEKREAKSGKVSRRDYAVITRDLLCAAGINARVGYFRSADSQFKERTVYYVVEYWSRKYSKWIVLDCLDIGYFMNGDSKLSALEVLNGGIKEISYLGNTGQKDYKSKLRRYLDSYTIGIDNTIAQNKSNSYVCYVKNDKALEIKWCKSYAPPTIFTKSSLLFERSPYDDTVTKDTKAYLILCLSEDKDKEGTKTVLTIAGFQNGSIMNSYYIDVNNKGYKQINKYEKINIEKGVTSIKLSIDGKTEISSVKIDRQK